MKQLFGSSGLENMRRNSSAATSCAELLDVGENPGERGVVALGARQLEQLLGVGQAAADAVERADHRLQRLLFLAQLLRALRVFPQLGVFELAVQRRQALLLGVEVKDTSAAPPTAPAGPTERRRSG